MLATFAGLATAGPQPSATPKPLATTVNGSRSNGDSITGKVSQVGRGTFTLTAKGKQYKFLLPKGGAQPKVGAVLDVTYTGTLGGAQPAQATTVISSRSNGSY